MSENQELYQIATVEQHPMTVTEIVDQVNLIQNVMKAVMRDGEHYGLIPGTGKKPSLLKPGAEKLSMTFRMAPKYEIQINDMPGGHREYEVVCNLYSINSGVFLGAGVGECSTMETKYRFRTGPVEETGKPVPKEYWDTRKSNPEKAQMLIGGRGFSTAKAESGAWQIVVKGERVEHDNPADYYNTVKKMAKKRAFVDAILTVTSASDIFTQDIEELQDNGVIPKAEEKKESKPPITPPSRTSEQTPTQPAGEGKISENQGKRFFAIASGAKKSKEEIESFLYVQIGSTHTGDIPKTRYDELCTLVTTWTPGQAEAHDGGFGPESEMI